MSECIISGGGRTVYIAGSGGGSIAASAPPVLNTYNPIDGEIKASESILLSVFVEENNINCTYQWFVNDNVVIGANTSTFEYIPEDIYATNKIKCAVTNSKGTTYSRESSILVWPTRWYIIKNATIVDESAYIDNVYGSSKVTVSGTKISTNYYIGNGTRYVKLVSPILSKYSKSVYASFTTNSYYANSYSVGIYTDYENDEWDIVNNNTIKNISKSIERVEIYVASSSEGNDAYIRVNEFYIE